MSTSTAHVSTDRPGRYGKQLVSHLTRKATGEWDEAAGTGWLEFPMGGRGELSAADGALDLQVTGDNLDQLENVVGSHLVRFGAKDELVVVWTRDDGTAGTEQREAEPTDHAR
jgi:hypothetical protein